MKKLVLLFGVLLTIPVGAFAGEMPPAATPIPAFSLAQDAALVKLQKSLPKGWSLTIEGDRLVIRSASDVWALFENRINAPVSRETEAQRNARIIKHGKKIRSAIVLRLETKWSQTRLDAARAKNARIRREVAALVDRHGLSPVFQGNSKLTPEALAERRGLGDAYRRYEREKKALEAGLIVLPGYQSALYSLWFVSTQGVTDELTLVHPDAVSAQNHSIRGSLGKVLTVVAP